MIQDDTKMSARFVFLLPYSFWCSQVYSLSSSGTKLNCVDRFKRPGFAVTLEDARYVCSVAYICYVVLCM